MVATLSGIPHPDSLIAYLKRCVNRLDVSEELLVVSVYGQIAIKYNIRCSHAVFEKEE